MSGDATPNLDLIYLDASQSQPEVKINDAWNKIDEAIGNISPSSDSSETGTALTIEDSDSPHTSVADVAILKVAGALVTELSPGVALITIEAVSGLSVLGDESPSAEVNAVSIIRFRGASVEQGSGGAADVDVNLEPIADGQIIGNTSGETARPIAIGIPQNAESAGWNSSNGAVQTTYAVPQDLIVPYACTLREVIILTQGGPGSCTVELWKCAFAAFPPNSGNDMTGGAPPGISSGNVHDDTVLAGWTKALAQNDVIRATLSVNANFTSVKIILRMY